MKGSKKRQVDEDEDEEEEKMDIVSPSKDANSDSYQGVIDRSKHPSGIVPKLQYVFIP